MFYRGKTLVFDPTSITGGIAAVRENVRKTLHKLNNILSLYEVKSATLILNGNIWRYFEELLLLAEMIRDLSAVCYIDGIRYDNLDEVDARTHPTRNRLNVILGQGNRCTRQALLWGLTCGDAARLYGWPEQVLHEFSMAQKCRQ